MALIKLVLALSVAARAAAFSRPAGPRSPFARRAALFAHDDVSRRSALLTSTSVGGAVVSTLLRAPATAAAAEPSTVWKGLTPQGPFFHGDRRRTVLRELVPGQMWALEQVQGVIYVHVPVRMTLVRTDAAGLVAYGAVAPTGEMLALLERVERELARCRLAHVILPSTAIEHKLFALAVADKRADCTLWSAPDQFAFPLDLPARAIGFPGGARARDVPRAWAADATPWARELEFRTLGPFVSKDGVSNYEEVVAYHAASRTLLVCDLLVSVPAAPPDAVRANDARALWYHARARAEDEVAGPADGDAALLARREAEGWQKIALFSLYFQSGALRVTAEPDGTARGALAFFDGAFPPGVSARARALGWGAFFAWAWPDERAWRESFFELALDGAPLVPPILAVAILNRDPRRVVDFVDEFCAAWPFERFVGCHFDAPARCNARSVRDAFRFLEEGAELNDRQARRRGRQPDGDLAFLRNFEKTLVEANAIYPRGPLVPQAAAAARRGLF